MALARSKITAQGQISIPAAVRKRLGVGPGSILVWDEDKGDIVVRRAGAHTSEEIHEAVFPQCAPKPKSLKELKEGVRSHVRNKHERR